MNKNPLEQKLINNSKERVESNHSDISKVKLLLAADAAEEISVLKSIGLDHHIKVAENKQGDNIIRTTGEEKFGKPIVALAEIERLCKDYRLYMRKANEYIGSIPNDLGVELKHFCKKCEIDTTVKNSDYSDFYIIAPPKMFKNYTRPINNLLGTFDNMREEREAKIRARELDPILVYKDPNNAGYYAIVKSWGNDFTPVRKLYAMLTSETFINFIISFTARALIPYLIYLFYAYMNNGTTLMHEHNGRLHYDVLNFIIQCVVGIAIIIVLVNSIEKEYVASFRRSFIKRVCIKPITSYHYERNRR
jgi:hypothetical protein